MGSERRLIRVERLLRRCTILEPDAASVFETVFCAEQARSVDVVACAQCARFAGRNDSAAPSLVCDWQSEDAEIATRANVARLMALETVCVRGDVQVAKLRALRLAPGMSVPVVDPARTLVGVVLPHDLAPIDDPFAAWNVARDVMGPRTLRLPEWATVRDAAAFMVSKRVRSAVVVDTEGHVAGVVDDLALLRWVAARAERVPAG